MQDFMRHEPALKGWCEHNVLSKQSIIMSDRLIKSQSSLGDSYTVKQINSMRAYSDTHTQLGQRIMLT